MRAGNAPQGGALVTIRRPWILPRERRRGGARTWLGIAGAGGGRRAGVRFGLREFLEAKGFEVDEAATCMAAEAMFQARRPDVAILDYSLPDGNALDLLPRLRALDASVPLVILTGHGSIDLAVRAVKEGAEHFLTKPVELPALLVILRRLIDAQRSRPAADRGRTPRGARA